MILRKPTRSGSPGPRTAGPPRHRLGCPSCRPIRQPVRAAGCLPTGPLRAPAPSAERPRALYLRSAPPPNPTERPPPGRIAPGRVAIARSAPLWTADRDPPTRLLLASVTRRRHRCPGARRRWGQLGGAPALPRAEAAPPLLALPHVALPP